MASFLFPGVTVSAMLLSQVFLFIVSLIAMIFTSGYIYMLLNMSRGREYGLGDLLHMFRNQPDRVLVAGFVLSLIDNILLLPLTYWTVMTSPAAETMEAYLSWVQTAGILMVLGMALAVVIKLPLSLTFFLLADHPEMGGVEALKTSVRLMKGKKWKYFVLQLSFVPLLILVRLHAVYCDALADSLYERGGYCFLYGRLRRVSTIRRMTRRNRAGLQSPPPGMIITLKHRFNDLEENMDIILEITGELKVQRWQVEAAVKLIDEGCTIPFISRYRKEGHRFPERRAAPRAS